LEGIFIITTKLTATGVDKAESERFRFERAVQSREVSQ